MIAMSRENVPANVATVTGATAVVVGGMLAAFLAHSPSEVAMWASSYLVLVVGVAQIGFGLTLARLAPASTVSLWLAFALYNIGNICVLLGTVFKADAVGSSLVGLGGLALMVAMACMAVSVHHAKRSPLLIGFYIIVLIILVSTPIGLWLARR